MSVFLMFLSLVLQYSYICPLRFSPSIFDIPQQNEHCFVTREIHKSCYITPFLLLMMLASSIQYKNNNEETHHILLELDSSSNSYHQPHVVYGQLLLSK
jgi:hypothetical protein